MADLTIPDLVKIAAQVTDQASLELFFRGLLSLEEWNSSQEEFLEFMDEKPFYEQGLTIVRVYKLGGTTSGPLERVYSVETQGNPFNPSWFFAMYGTYDSYGGYDFETVKLVQPFTFTETRYK